MFEPRFSPLRPLDQRKKFLVVPCACTNVAICELFIPSIIRKCCQLPKIITSPWFIVVLFLLCFVSLSFALICLFFFFVLLSLHIILFTFLLLIGLEDKPPNFGNRIKVRCCEGERSMYKLQAFSNSVVI